MDVGRKQSRQKKLKNKVKNQTSGEIPQTRDLEGLDHLVHQESCQRAVEELENLPEDLRQVLYLKIMEGMKLREIAEVTGLTSGNVGYRLNRGLKMLSLRLKKAGLI